MSRPPILTGYYPIDGDDPFARFAARARRCTYTSTLARAVDASATSAFRLSPHARAVAVARYYQGAAEAQVR